MHPAEGVLTNVAVAVPGRDATVCISPYHLAFEALIVLVLLRTVRPTSVRFVPFLSLRQHQHISRELSELQRPGHLRERAGGLIHAEDPRRIGNAREVLALAIERG